MGLKVTHEDTEYLKSWGLGLEKLVERCTLCNKPTRYWYTPRNVPLCPDCAVVSKASDLPNKRLKFTLPPKEE